MKIKYCYSLILAVIIGLGFAVQAGATADQSGGLAGRVFAVEAEVLFSLDPSVPVGDEFQNCYIFNEDGSWEDPLFPDPSAPVPGTWVQHTELPKIRYTATVDDSVPGLLLIQNGTVNPSRGKSSQRLEAYTTVFFGGDLIIEVVSRGRAVESCPFF